jgi:hypothetical protein
MEEGKKDRELRFLYKITADDIERTKGRQWSAVCFSLLIFAGIIGFYKLMEIRFAYFYWFQRPFMVSLGVLVNLIGLYLLMDTQRSLYVLRERLAVITNKFEQDIRDVLEISPVETGKTYSYLRHFWFPMLPFVILIMSGFLCVALMLINFHPMAILAGVLIVNISFLIYLYASNKRKLQKANPVEPEIP